MDYDRENVVEEVRGLAEVRLSGPVTLRYVEWGDGDFQVSAFHTIDATYPFAAEARGEEDGLPFYRERLTFSTTGEDGGWVRHEVVRRRCGRTGGRTVWSKQVGGYTFNWPAPIADDEGEEPSGVRIPYNGRFA